MDVKILKVQLLIDFIQSINPRHIFEFSLRDPFGYGVEQRRLEVLLPIGAPFCVLCLFVKFCQLFVRLDLGAFDGEHLDAHECSERVESYVLMDFF